MKLSRADRSLLAEWSFTIDRGLLIALLSLVAIGVVLSVAASPAVALKKGLPTYYFVERHVFFAALGTLLMIVISFFSPAGVRRLAALLFLVAVTGMIAVFFSGTEINGAQRWLTFGSYSLQPSEFAKPAFIVIIAWLFGEAASRSDMPALPFALILWVSFAGILVIQPDVGQTVLISTTAGLLYLLAGLPTIGAALLVFAGSGGMWLAYEFFPHVHARFDKHFGSAPIETSQAGRAIQSFTEGGPIRQRPGRRDDQISPSRCPHRLHLRGDRRGIWRDRLHRSAGRLCLHRRQGDAAGDGGAQCRGSAGDPGFGPRLRASISDQHGRQHRPVAAEGYDAAIYFSGRIFNAGAFRHCGDAARADAAAARSATAQKAAMDSGRRRSTTRGTYSDNMSGT